MTHLLLLGAGFSHNWGAPLAKAVTGSHWNGYLFFGLTKGTQQ